MIKLPEVFWNRKSADVITELASNTKGLSQTEASQRLTEFGPNLLHPKIRLTTLELFLSQFRSPIIIILLFAAILSFFLQDSSDALIILIIVLISGVLGFWQEKGATDAVSKLLKLVQVTAAVIRDGKETEMPVDDVVPGDIVDLRGGDIVPADCLVLDAKDFFTDEATLTGETYPVEKFPGIVPPDATLAHRTNVVFMGTHVVSGSAQVLAVHTAKQTEFGQLASRLAGKVDLTEFEVGIKRFGYFLMVITLLMVFAIFAINIFLAKPVLDSFLFALALAVGLTPQLLPAIISINLSHGAKRMALGKVIVKRLTSIENLGSMNILCSDKTGTLTEGIIKVNSTVNAEGRTEDKVWQYAFMNSSFETSFLSPIDEAIRRQKKFDLKGWEKLDEVPYDFVRKRLSVLVKKNDRQLLITKGAVPNVLPICSQAEVNGKIVPLTQVRKSLDEDYQNFSREGFRLLAVAYRELSDQKTFVKEDEGDMIFLGFLVLSDPVKSGVKETVQELKKLGVSLKIITGDNRLVSDYVARQVGIISPVLLTGSQIAKFSDEALVNRVVTTDIFAEVEPNQKERLLQALRKSGNVVGFLGDGINDSSAIHAADVGISVNTGVDVAKEAASIVLLRKDLRILKEGIIEGRRTFANTMKYIFMATSANFGNMFSMAGSSLLLPFLPLLPKQILLLNLLTDLPEMTIATDNVDSSWVEKPRKWDIGFIHRFMILFGPISSVFDFMTFGALLWLKVAIPTFQTGWFLESIVSAAIIVLVVRSRQTFFRSRPSKYLFVTTLVVVIVAHLLPFTNLNALFGFTPLPLSLVIILDSIVLLYVVTAEVAKKIFYTKLVS